ANGLRRPRRVGRQGGRTVLRLVSPDFRTVTSSSSFVRAGSVSDGHSVADACGLDTRSSRLRGRVASTRITDTPCSVAHRGIAHCVRWGPHMSTCPSEARLRQLLAEQLVGPDGTAVETHLEDCDSCRQTVEVLLATELDLRAVPQLLAGRRADDVP